MTHLPAALQRSLAWQSTLLFDWDGMTQPYFLCMRQNIFKTRSSKKFCID